MKKTSFLSLLGGLIIFSLSIDASAIGEGSRMSMAVSPIRDEFVVSTGSALTRQMTFYNNADVPYSVYISTEDCQPGTNYGTPICKAPVNPGIDISKASTWITTSATGVFSVPAKGNRVISYTVTVPVNGYPGGHYGAIFFNNPDLAIAGNTVKMNRRIGMLYLLTVPGDIIVETHLGDILIDPGPGGGLWANDPSSVITFFSAPNKTWREKLHRFMMIFTDPEESAKLLYEVNPFWEKPVLEEEDFIVTLKLPFENSGNTHVRPTGKVYLHDGEKRLERIGKQAVVNENGVYLGEKVVDFLPINDEDGNVLPGTERVFSVDWKGFAFDDIDHDTGAKTIGFESPSNYYSRMNNNDAQFLYPWEKLSIRNMEKLFLANVELSFKNPLTGLDEVSSLELPVNTKFQYIAKTLNYGLLIILILILLLIMLIRKLLKGDSKPTTAYVVNKKIHRIENEIEALEHAAATSLEKVLTKKGNKVPAKKPVAIKKEVIIPPPVKTRKTPVAKKSTKKTVS